MGLVLPTIEAYQVQHLPIVKAYADKIGLVEVINQVVPTEMGIDPGTIVLGMILDTLSGRSPLYRLEEFFAHQDTALLLGKAVAPEAFNDDTVGRVLERLYDMGTMKIFTACAVRADQVFGFDKRYVHFDTTSIRVYGDYLPPEGQPDQQAQAVPFTITYGYSKDKRPDLKQFVFSTLCVDRAVPLWGKPEDGNASDKTVNNTLLSDHRDVPGPARGSARRLHLCRRCGPGDRGQSGRPRATPCSSPAYPPPITSAGGSSPRPWRTTPGRTSASSPTRSRPSIVLRRPIKSRRARSRSTGRPYRAVVVHSSAQDKRRQQRLARDIQASYSTMQTTARTAEQQEYFCRADADAAAAQLRAVPTRLPSGGRHGGGTARVWPGPAERPQAAPGQSHAL